jgi:hypothetical protein
VNQELRDLFVADHADRNDHPAYDTPEYWHLRERDAAGRQRVNELLHGRFLEADRRIRSGGRGVASPTLG